MFKQDVFELTERVETLEAKDCEGCDTDQEVLDDIGDLFAKVAELQKVKSPVVCEEILPDQQTWAEKTPKPKVTLGD